jgi:hypothetical protein
VRQINLRISDKLVRDIDRLRGNVPRDRFLRAIVTRDVRYYSDDPGFDAREFAEQALEEDTEFHRMVAAIDRVRGSESRFTFVITVMTALATAGTVTLPT